MSTQIRYAHRAGSWVGVGFEGGQSGVTVPGVSMRRCTCGELVTSIEDHWSELEQEEMV